MILSVRFFFTISRYVKSTPFQVNRQLNYDIFKISGETVLKMQALGMPVVTLPYLNGPETYSTISASVRAYRYARVRYEDNWWPWQGVYIGNFFEERFDAAGVDLRLNTSGEALILEDGAVVGVRLTGPNSTYTVYAKKIILACGGIMNNRELVNRYAPDFAGTLPYVNASCRGDGLVMAEAVDAVVEGNTMAGNLGLDMHCGFWTDMGSYFPAAANVILVDVDGNRFMRDSGGYPATAAYNTVCTLPEARAYAIFDANNPAAALAEASVMQHCIWKADTVEELAGMIGVSAENLVETVNKFNAAYEAGEDAEFDTPNSSMLPITEAPFYAVILQSYTYATMVGLRVTESCEVVNSADIIVPNLYAVGEMNYTGGIRCVPAAVFTGRIAGEHAKAAVLA